MMTINSINDVQNGTIADSSAASGSKDRKALGLYIHIPFCISKCAYCDFLSFGGCDDDTVARYFDVLRREIVYCDKMLSDEYRADTVFIGGGTPSCVPESEISGLMDTLRGCRLFENVDSNTRNARDEKEITIEANPGTVNKIKMSEYLKSGINRISFGAQSFFDRTLSSLGRIHNTGDIIRNYSQALNVGFDNINLDLMFGVPGQTLGEWIETLKTAISLQPRHISFYSLQIEENTPMYRKLTEGRLDEISDDLNRTMYYRAIEMLESEGYVHYEISNAAKAGYECRHNLKYWSMDSYLGIGLGAHSFLNGRRFSNPTDIEEYISGSEEERWKSSYSGGHENDRNDNLEEFMFTGLRRIAGINTAEFQRIFGCSVDDMYGRELRKLCHEGLIFREKHSDDEYEDIRLSLRGIDISNTVLCEFIKSV